MDGDTKQPAAELAYQAIRARIMSGDLGDGARLKEQSLASEMGLSRTPVRAAITRLIHEGFAERGEGYSTRVAHFPEDELDQIFEIRRRLECYAAERAATLASTAQIEELDRLTTEMEALSPPQTDADYARISEINAAFHRIISEAAQSPRLMAVLSMAVDVGIVSRTYHSYAAHDLIRSARHHRELVDAFRARAPDWAASVMSSHVLAAAKSAARPRRVTG
ncbi:GntR family transcriptional regulator [Thalassococcus sp. S3]|uniref:GntR family transcriptional regulator n=1 Tax=Thalassococcus sp. S3 TaxID=2017482 RepID=UPI0020C5126C|nr:GntR family transcriptional regulator [Thalassococcus sp. S3]